VGLRTLRYTYVEHEGGDRELYGMQKDPHQIDNIHGRADDALLDSLR